MKNKKMVALLLSSLLLSACANNTTASTQTTEQKVVATSIDTTDMFTSRDLEVGYDETQSTQITLSGTSANFESENVKLENGVLSITQEGTYILSGQFDGMIKIEAPEDAKVQLVLNSVSITNPTSAPIYVKSANKVFITTASETQNSLASGNEYVAVDENNIDSVIFSKSDLTLNGSGTLTINSPSGHGIVSKDDLVITTGTYNITAKDNGLSANNSVRIANGEISITSENDGIKAENEDTTKGFVYIANGKITINAQGDAISGSGYVLAESGEFNLTSGGGAENGTQKTEKMNFRDVNISGATPNGENSAEAPQAPQAPQSDVQAQTETQTDTQTETQTTEQTSSTKGIKSGTQLIIQGGQYNINSADDGLNSDDSIEINGETLSIASGSDGADADISFLITNGTLNITKSYEGIEAKTIDIAGGETNIVASDDGVNATSPKTSTANSTNSTSTTSTSTTETKQNTQNTNDVYIKISAGKLTVDASGDGIDSNGNIEVTGGETYVFGPTNDGNGYLDYDGKATITGGIFIATGSGGMAQNFGTDSTQGSFITNLSGEAQTTLTVTDSTGKEIATVTPTKAYSSVLVSTPEIQKSKTYTVSNGTTSSEVEMTDLITGGGTGFGAGHGGQGGQFPEGEFPEGGRGKRGVRPTDTPPSTSQTQTQTTQETQTEAL